MGTMPSHAGRTADLEIRVGMAVPGSNGAVVTGGVNDNNTVCATFKGPATVSPNPIKLVCSRPVVGRVR